MTAPELRAELDRLGLSQVRFAQVLRDLGDERPQPTILRTVQELVRPGREAAVPWSVAVLVRLMGSAPDAWRKVTQQTASGEA